MVRRFEYVAWFRDRSLPPSDQGHEWPAVFVVEAPTGERAKAWGDHLARSYSARTEQPLIGSSATATEDVAHDLSRVPVVREGIEASDQDIGW
jgi:hypothetical protein